MEYEELKRANTSGMTEDELDEYHERLYELERSINEAKASESDCTNCGISGVSPDPRFKLGNWCENCQDELQVAEDDWWKNADEEEKRKENEWHDKPWESEFHNKYSESMTQMDDLSDSPSTVDSGRKIMKGQLKAYNDNPTPEGDQYGQPLGFPWQYGGEGFGSTFGDPFFDYTSKKHSELSDAEKKEDLDNVLQVMGYTSQGGGEAKISSKRIPKVDLYQGGQKVGIIEDYNPKQHEGYVTLDGIGIKEFGAMPSEYVAYLNGERVPNKWDNQVDHNASLFGEGVMEDYQKYDESEVNNTESWGNWSDNEPPMIAHDQVKLMKDLGIADKTLRQMGYLHKDGVKMVLRDL